MGAKRVPIGDQAQGLARPKPCHSHTVPPPDKAQSETTDRKPWLHYAPLITLLARPNLSDKAQAAREVLGE